MIDLAAYASRADLCAALATDKRLAIDGGAHVGNMTRELLRHFEHVIAFEPAAENALVYRQNIIDWGVADRVTFYEAALWRDDKGCEVIMPPKRTSDLSHCIAPGGPVPTMTIEQLNLAHLGLLKLDLEGAELQVLGAAVHTIKALRPVVMIEEDIHAKRFGDKRYDARLFLESIGMEVVHEIRPDVIFAWL